MDYKQKASEVQCVLKIQQHNFFVPINLLLLVRRVFPHLAGAADIGSWVVLASVPGAWSSLAWGVELELLFDTRILGNRSCRDRYHPSATAYSKPLCGPTTL